MKTIQVQVIEETDMARQYDASFYPADGLYLWSVDASVVMIENGLVTFLTFFMTWASFVGTGQSVGAITGESISADTLLKAIAITQQPELIKEI